MPPLFLKDSKLRFAPQWELEASAVLGGDHSLRGLFFGTLALDPWWKVRLEPGCPQPGNL